MKKVKIFRGNDPAVLENDIDTFLNNVNINAFIPTQSYDTDLKETVICIWYNETEL